MPETPKKPDPEMSAASKAKAARQPRQAGGKFASTTNAQEQEVIDLKLELQAATLLDEYHFKTLSTIGEIINIDLGNGSVNDLVPAVRHLRERADKALELEARLENQRVDTLALSQEMEALRAELAKAKEDVRLLTIGNKQLIEARDAAEENLSRERLSHATTKVDYDTLNRQVGNLTHDRDAMEQEVDRLTGVLATVTAERDAANGQVDVLKAKLSSLEKHCRTIRFAGYVFITLGCFATFLLCQFFGGGK